MKLRLTLSAFAGAAMISAITAPLLAQNDGADIKGQVDLPPLTEQQMIEVVVAQLNARAVPGTPQIGQTGELITSTGPAARTFGFNAPAPRGGPCSVDVAILGADTAPRFMDVSSKLLANPRIASVTAIDLLSVTPTAAELLAFDSVLVWTNSTPIDPPALGDSLADYTDAGGGVVLSMFALRAIEPRTILGRFLTDNYYAIERTVDSNLTGAATLGTVHVPGALVMTGVTNFDGGTIAFRTPAPLNPLATRVADWSTGEILVATRDDLPGRRVDLGFWPVSSDIFAGAWVASTHGARLMANSLAFAGGCPDVGLQGCGPGLFAQSPPDPTLGARNSNTPSNNFTSQQIADDFALGGGGEIRRVTLWGLYTGDNSVPTCQRMVVNFHSDVAGDPGPVIHTSTVSVMPEYTGTVATGLGLNRRLYRFTIDLTTPFVALPRTTYWISPLGHTAANQFAWQFHESSGDRRSRTGPDSSWTTFSSNLAFELCGTDCEADFNGDGTVNSQDFFDFLTAFFTGC